MIPEAAPASKPTEIPPRGWKEVLKATWKEGGKDNISLVAAGVAFYAFTALVPLLTAFVLTYGLVAEPSSVVSHTQMLTSAMPEQSASIIGDQLKSMSEGAGTKTGFALLLALLIALYGASKGAGSLMTGLNIAWGTTESRGFVKRTLVAIFMVAGSVVAMVGAILAMSAMNFLEELMPALGGVGHFFIKLLSFALAAALVMAVLAAIYRYGPDRPNAKWKWVTPGSIVATIVWVLATVGFGFYVSNFGSYNATYGSLGAIIVFLTWLYLTAYIILLGGEMNAVLEEEVAAAPQARQAEGGAQGQAQSVQPMSQDEALRQPALAQAKAAKEKETQPASAGALALRFGAAAILTALLGSSARRKDQAAA
jgi:membrane protein